MPVNDEVLAQLAAVVSEFEGKFSTIHDYVWNGMSPARAPTGEFYVEIIEGRYPASNEAIEGWRKRVYNLVPCERGSDDQYHPANSTAALYWRIRPEINHFPKSKYNAGGWSIYSRLLISDQPRKLSESTQKLADKLDDLIYNHDSGAGSLHTLINKPKET